MLSIFKPAPHKARLPAAEIDPTYRRLRWQIFLGIFFGYAAYYLVRKNFALAMPYLVEQGFSRGDLGFALSGISIAYGFSKFIMGSVSDRSNPRVFLPAGLILAAAVMLFMGFVPWATSSIAIMFVLLFLCGWFQGMGWPPCGRTMVHWWSQKERGGIVSVWNCAHNVGGGIPPLLFLLGMAWFNDWHAALYMPAFGAILVAIIAFALMRDTPQSCGLLRTAKRLRQNPAGVFSFQNIGPFNSRPHSGFVHFQSLPVPATRLPHFGQVPSPPSGHENFVRCISINFPVSGPVRISNFKIGSYSITLPLF